jgi:acetate kinase
LKVLIINCGSSSVKYQLMDTSDESVLAKGIVERIGFEDAIFTHIPINGEKQVQTLQVKNHDIAMKHVLTVLVGEKGVLKSLTEIGAVGHRFVNGGREFIEPVVATGKVLEKLHAIVDIAPLHNSAHLLGIEACLASMPDTPQAIVFDTSFHARIPAKAFMYALPYRYYEKYGIRRYGFHGTSHYYVSHKAAEIMRKPVEDLKIITCHLGNGCSIDAVKDGWAVDTSMGFTPLEGLIMGTRTGDIDCAAPLYIMKKEGISPEDMDTIMNKKSGLLGVTGISSDMREINNAAKEGNELAILALDMYCYRIKKYISSYTGILGGLDVLVFTAGVGEHSPVIREKACEGLSFLGIDIDKEKNDRSLGGNAEIGKENARVRVLVIPTNEELVIAREAERMVKKV